MRGTGRRNVSRAVEVRLAWLAAGVGAGYLLTERALAPKRERRAQSRPAPETAHDKDLIARVYDALPSWRGACSIEAHDGQVVLRGEVSRVEDIAAVEVDVRNVEGVDEVINLMHLESTAG